MCFGGHAGMQRESAHLAGAVFPRSLVAGQRLQGDDFAPGLRAGGDAVGDRTHPQCVHAVFATRAGRLIAPPPTADKTVQGAEPGWRMSSSSSRRRRRPRTQRSIFIPTTGCCPSSTSTSMWCSSGVCLRSRHPPHGPQGRTVRALCAYAFTRCAHSLGVRGSDAEGGTTA
jgi:hypothetical protein